MHDLAASLVEALPAIVLLTVLIVGGGILGFIFIVALVNGLIALWDLIRGDDAE